MKSSRVLVATACLVFTSQAALAGPVVDGKFDPGEGYTHGYNVTFYNQDSPSVIRTGMQLWVSQDATTGNATMAVILPTDLVDNSYGDTKVGWGSNAPSGKNHSFGDLKGSDKLEMILKDTTGATIFDFDMDYLHDYGGSWPDKWRSGGVTDGEGKMNLPSDETLMVNAETSLGYNFAQYGSAFSQYFGSGADSPEVADYTNDDPNDPSAYQVINGGPGGWIFDVIYEFEINGSVLGNWDIDSPFAPGSSVFHISPNKLGGNKNTGVDITPITPPNPNPIPEPSALALFGLGMLGIAARRRRRRRQK